MRWRDVVLPPPPVLVALVLGAVMGLALLSTPAPPTRLSKAQKRELKRESRRRGRAFIAKRASSKRRAERLRLVEELGVDVVRQMTLDQKRKKEELRARLEAAKGHPLSLRMVVDLAWAETLSDKELSSLRKQLCYAYGHIRKSPAPACLTLASYRGRASEVLQSTGAESWVVERNPSSVFEIFDPRDVVYLSPDAHDVLEDVLPTKVYVVGGIVDRNLKRGLTLTVAEGRRAQAVRLPFDIYLPGVPSKDRVLTVFACVKVLVARHAGGDWREILGMSVPSRVRPTGDRGAGPGPCRGAASSAGTKGRLGDETMSQPVEVKGS